jgi:hypothetical protein
LLINKMRYLDVLPQDFDDFPSMLALFARPPDISFARLQELVNEAVLPDAAQG